MSQTPAVIKSNETLTPYRFYNEFLEDVATFYRENPTESIRFKLFQNGDEEIYNSNYRIDPIVLPLLLSLFEQLSNYHKKPLRLLLFNNIATINALEFLYRCDFFYVAGINKPQQPVTGRNILDFDSQYLGAFRSKIIRREHRIRAYSGKDDDLPKKLLPFETEEQKRDFLISHFTYKVREHFAELLFDNQFTVDYHNLYIDILSELITNSVLHSKSTAFALMFVDRYKTKFSISDNGVGFKASMQLKEETPYYKPYELKNILEKKQKLKNISRDILDNLFIIFETLFFSSLKDRHGLFDLMITVVLQSRGYFRIHNENSQVVISNRMMDELSSLSAIREKIYEAHTLYNLHKYNETEWKHHIETHSREMFSSFIHFCDISFSKYNSDIRYSSIRFYKVKFRGVHIEVEIPNSLSDDSLSD